VRVFGCVQLEQHQPVRVQHVLEPQRLGARPQTAQHGRTVQQDAQRSIEAARTAVLHPAVLVLEPTHPVADARIVPIRIECSQERFPVEQASKSGQIHRLTAQGERPGRPQRPLVRRIAIDAPLGGIVLGLEQQVGHLVRPRVEQIGRQFAVDRPHLPAVGAHRRLQCRRALRVDDDARHLVGHGLDEQLQPRGLSGARPAE
jgi:hypothetical protein